MKINPAHHIHNQGYPRRWQLYFSAREAVRLWIALWLVALFIGFLVGRLSTEGTVNSNPELVYPS